VDVSDPADQQRLQVAFEQLDKHISKEEDASFLSPCNAGRCRMGSVSGGLV
jgi:hypothetical protein